MENIFKFCGLLTIPDLYKNLSREPTKIRQIFEKFKCCKNWSDQTKVWIFKKIHTLVCNFATFEVFFDNFGIRYIKRVFFNQLSKLYFSFDAQLEIQIMNRL